MRSLRSTRLPILFAATAVAATACDPRVNLGSIGDGGASLLWSATFEPGDLSEWIADSAGGSYFENIMVGPSAISEIAHAGRFAGKVTLNPAMGMPSSNYLFREAPSPTEAYYSAWYHFPSPLAVPSWLSIVHFRGSHTADGRNVFPTWDVNLYSQANGNLVAHLYDFVTQTIREQASPIAVPLDAWVHFEVFLRKAAGPTGRVAVWQDDVLIFNVEGVTTSETNWVQWDVGGASDAVNPAPAVMYVDDAAISVSRIGTASH